MVGNWFYSFALFDQTYAHLLWHLQYSYQALVDQLLEDMLSEDLFLVVKPLILLVLLSFENLFGLVNHVSSHTFFCVIIFICIRY